MQILHGFPDFVTDDLVEILYNFVVGKVPVGSRKAKFAKHKRSLLDLVNAKSKNGRRQVIYRQKGGFLGGILPMVISAIGGMLGSKIL
jgi:hypothetical protein